MNYTLRVDIVYDYGDDIAAKFPPLVNIIWRQKKYLNHVIGMDYRHVIDYFPIYNKHFVSIYNKHFVSIYNKYFVLFLL